MKFFANVKSNMKKVVDENRKRYENFIKMRTNRAAINKKKAVSSNSKPVLDILELHETNIEDEIIDSLNQDSHI